jgi:hypothetical protein
LVSESSSNIEALGPLNLSNVQMGVLAIHGFMTALEFIDV